MSASSASRTALLWYRRDLRLHDHPALHAAGEYERLVPVFVLDPTLLHGRSRSRPRTEFMLATLTELDEGLRALGSGLAVRHGEPAEALTALAAQAGAQHVLWTSDVSPYARARDREVADALAQAGVTARPHGGNYIVDISTPRTRNDEPFRVFSPFWRQWLTLPRRDPLPAPRGLPRLPEAIDLGPRPAAMLAECVDASGLAGKPAVTAGETAARHALAAWLKGPLGRYAERHDAMAGAGTSRLSPYLRWGSLSARECAARAGERGGPGAGAWVRQLCWREFYAHVLLNWPQNLRLEFQERFRELPWDDPGERLPAWQRGETGYPVVDAGMRQLAGTGWMHNRARLIAGSFLTKDLHLDWRHGERHFDRLLLDGEPAQNNGNWQWIASVGVDPAPPYRRMYNPTRQGRQFDPHGAYVRQWVPELADVPDERLFEPWTMSAAEQRAAGCRVGRDYPAPIVDHAVERRRALARYAGVGGT